MKHPLFTGIVFSAFAASAVLGSQAAFGRPAAEILKEFDSTQSPTPDMGRITARDEAYIAEYRKAAAAWAAKRQALAKELMDTDPSNSRLPQLIEARWADPAFAAEVDGVVASGKPEPLVPSAHMAKSGRLLSALRESPDKYPEARAAVEAFAEKYPTDPRLGHLVLGLYQTAPEEQRQPVAEMILAKFPQSPAAGLIRSDRKQAAAVGKPFELTFTDAVSGKEISMKSLKGKVVVVDFWATWCGPCVAEMPHLKELYAKWKDKGVEFIGVSLDLPEEKAGGLTKLKQFVAKNEIPWPQYYQGKGWESDFSKSWGIASVPALFVIDTDGNLASVNGRGRLETLIAELLAKGKKQ